MSNVELIVTVQDEKTVRLRRESGSEEPGTITQDELNKATVNLLVRWLNRGLLGNQQEFMVLGTHLYHLLFNGKVATFFVKALDDSKAKNERLSLQLSFEPQAVEISALPWEYLYYPDTQTSRGFFLATDLKLAISRFLPLEPISSEGETGKLKILIAISQPKGLGPVAAEPVKDAILKLKELNPIDIHTLESPTVDKLLEELADFKPHILHFLGHGQLNKDGAGEIALLNPEEEGPAWYNFWNFVECFRFAETLPRLVFVHMNQGASAEFTATLRNLARELMLSGIQAVVVMQYPITNDVAIRFCRSFYPALAKGDFIDSAVQEARGAMIRLDTERYTNRVFGTPVLYMCSRANIIQPAGAGVSAGGRIEGFRPGGSTSLGTDAVRKLGYIFVAAEEQIDKANLSAGQQKSIRERLTSIRKTLERTPDLSKWCDILVTAWIQEEDEMLKDILRTMQKIEQAK